MPVQQTMQRSPEMPGHPPDPVLSALTCLPACLPACHHCRSIAAETARRLVDLAGWLFGRVEHRRSWWTAFERSCFPVRRWHLALGERGWLRVGVCWLGRAGQGWAKRHWLGGLLLTHTLTASPLLCLPLPCPHHTRSPAAAALFACNAAQWAARRWVEHISGARQRRKQLQQQLRDAGSHAEWAAAADEVRRPWARRSGGLGG
jgi:hypothetical protein